LSIAVAYSAPPGSAAGHRRQQHECVAARQGVERLEMANVGVVEERIDEPVQVAVGCQSWDSRPG
jgi:hypothetical protein